MRPTRGDVPGGVGVNIEDPLCARRPQGWPPDQLADRTKEFRCAPRLPNGPSASLDSRTDCFCAPSQVGPSLSPAVRLFAVVRFARGSRVTVCSSGRDEALRRREATTTSVTSRQHEMCGLAGTDGPRGNHTLCVLPNDVQIDEPHT